MKHTADAGPQPAAFLDRDGTLIVDQGYICDFRQVRVFDFAVAAVHLLNQLGYRVVLVTNQSAVARGICSEKQIRRLHRELQGYFSRHGATIDAVYYCPYLNNGAVRHYRRSSQLRKPQPGMLLQAARDLSLDLPGSYMIGDTLDDVAAGKAAGCRTIKVNTGIARPGEEPGPAATQADFTVATLLDAARLIQSLTINGLD